MAASWIHKSLSMLYTNV